MNWLAHLYLSEPDAAFRVGNVLPDLVPQSTLQALPPEFARGVACHRRIDAFTDSHPIFRQSIARLGPTHRRFGGVVMDMFYDHFLAANWERFSDEPLLQFTQSVYADLETCFPEVPGHAADVLRRMSADDWLGSYREVASIRLALNGIGRRLRKPRSLGDAVEELERHYEPLQKDFYNFFPLLREHAMGN